VSSHLERREVQSLKKVIKGKTESDETRKLLYVVVRMEIKT
jgi:hypothetical protein